MTLLAVKNSSYFYLKNFSNLILYRSIIRSNIEISIFEVYSDSLTKWSDPRLKMDFFLLSSSDKNSVLSFVLFFLFLSFSFFFFLSLFLEKIQTSMIGGMPSPSRSLQFFALHFKNTQLARSVFKPGVRVCLCVCGCVYVCVCVL